MQSNHRGFEIGISQTTKFEGTSCTRLPPPSHQAQIWEIVKIILSFDNLQEGLIKLNESYYAPNYDLLQKKDTD